ncbi:MAG: tRNA pseudouridine(38-40) synthase TruA [Candidatus Omnitrophota bacterium]
MRNIKLTIEYDGSRYAGWQVQGKKSRTIQEALEKALARILHKRLRVIGSGRTDAGVHAKGQVANFKTDSGMALGRLRGALNAVLPDDISIIRIDEAALDFHSRFSARSKVYRYTILNRPSRPAISRDAAYFFPCPLDLRLMREEAKLLLGRHDFKSFQAADKRERGSVRAIKKLVISRDRDFIHIDIEADGFLYNMVRNIAGTLIEIGRGKLPRGSMKKILLLKNRRFAGPTLPAKGLCLLEVKH